MLRSAVLRASMLILTLLPGTFFRVYPNAESLKEGLLVASVIAALLLMITGQTIKRGRFYYLLRRLSLAIFLITIHGLLNIFGDGFNVARFGLSITFLCALFIFWLPIAEALHSASYTELDFTLRWCYWILLLDGLSTTILYYLGIGNKRMFFASEPSHFALTFLPFLFYILFRDRSSWHLTAALAIAIFISNLTLLVGVSLLAMFYYRHHQIRLVLAFMLGGSLINLIPDFTNYAIDRLTLSSESTNLSALVFMSGYERAYETLLAGHWLGVGFQQMGFVGPTGKLIESIGGITGGNELNLLDGGTLASKIIVEFGILGIFLLLIYLAGLIRLYLHGRQDCLTPQILFFRGVYISFSCYLFVRGMGYMAPTVLLFFVGLLCFAAGEQVRRHASADTGLSSRTLRLCLPNSK